MIYPNLLCPTHSYPYISMPRGDDQPDELRFIAKCPMRNCHWGLKRGLTHVDLDIDLDEIAAKYGLRGGAM